MAKIFLDTNIIISTAIIPGKIAHLAYLAATEIPNRIVISDYVVSELLRKSETKFPACLESLRIFLNDIRSVAEWVETPTNTFPAEELIEDVKDRPILRAALFSQSDILLTGDKHFLRVRDKITEIRILSPTEFLNLHQTDFPRK